jgi:hypothetical protein
MAVNVFDKLACCRPVNKQTAFVAGGATKPPVWNDDVIKYNAEKLRLQQQEAFDRVAKTYVGELGKASSGSFYAKDYVKYAKRQIRSGKWTPGLDAIAPKRWVGISPKKARALVKDPLPGRINKRARREQRLMAAITAISEGQTR